MDPEKTVGLDSTCSTAAAVDNNEPHAHQEDSDVPLELANFPELKPSNTVLSTRSAREAARALDDFDDAPENPRNWPNGQRWRTTLIVAVTGFISTTGSSIAVPGIRAMMTEFGEPNEKVGVLVTACYVLGLGAGPFVFAPLSELYGRQCSYHISQVLYILFSLGTAVANNMVGLIILRFLCGACGSVGPALGVATCSDVFAPKERGRPIAVYAVGPMAGPVVGSMLGYWILYGGFRWLYWTITLMAAVNYVLLLLFTQETYAPVIQKKLRYQIQHPLADATSWRDRFSPKRIIHNLGWMKVMVSKDQARTVFGRAFSRPPRLLFGNPVCLLFSMYYAYIYGIIYVFLVSVPLLFGAPPFNHPGLFSYQWPQSTVSLSYLGLAFGFMCSVTVAATQQDRIYKYLSRRNGDNGQPEYRLVLTQIGMVVMPCGLLLFAWTAHAQTHWMGTLVGQALIGFGLMLAFNSIQNFLVDAFFPYSAAAIAAATALRSVVACILPIFSPQMFYTIGWGWGGTLLALISLIALPAPVLLFKFGKRLRDRFKFSG